MINDDDNDRDIPCVVCGRTADTTPITYVYDAASLTVTGYCAEHYHDRLVSVYGEETTQLLEEQTTFFAPMGPP